MIFFTLDDRFLLSGIMEIHSGLGISFTVSDISIFKVVGVS